MPNNQNDPYNQGGQPQQPIILGKRNVQQEQQMQQAQRLPEAEASGIQRQVEQPIGANQLASSGSGRSGVATFQQVAGKRTSFDMLDYILAIVAAVLVVAVIVTVIVFSSIFRLSFAALSNNFSRLLPYLLIYALCVVVGILWGRYQLDTASKRESVRLSGMVKQQNDDIERLNSANEKLQRDLFMTQSELAIIKKAPPPVLPPPGRIPPSYAYGKVVEPPKIDRIQPQQSIYDVTRDPPDFNEREQREHPHEKFYPDRGKSEKMQSGWNIIGASRRGYGHAYDGKYREDDFEIRRFKVHSPGMQPTMIMVAIADGVSSKAYSRRGARAAVRGATSVANSTHLQNLATYIGSGTPFNLWRDAAFNTLMESLSAAHDFIEQQGKEDRISVDEMQSTLLVYLAVPLEQHLFIASVQVGDGALFARQPAKGATPGERWKWLQHPQIQATGNEVQPFMRTGPDMWRQYLHAEVLDGPAFIMGMTDGTADDIESPRPTAEFPNPDPFFFVEDFYQHIATSVMNDPQPAEALLKFLDYRKKQSFDDRTVVCLYR